MKVKAYAKINLFLDITGIRQDGYHTLEMIMQSVSLCDEVEVSVSEDMTVYTEGVEQEKNIAYKAAKAFFEKTGIKGGLKVNIEKHIPMQAGLGGGSADAAAVLVCANELYGNPLNKEELLKLGNTLGADVPFALTGGTALAKGTGDELYSVNNNLRAVYLIVKPEGGVDTAKAFRLYDDMDITSSGDMEGAVKALDESDFEEFKKCAYNALEAPAKVICPVIDKVLEKLCSAKGVRAAFMTGSGSACVGVFENEQDAKAAKGLFCDENITSFIVKNTSCGTLLKKSGC